MPHLTSIKNSAPALPFISSAQSNELLSSLPGVLNQVTNSAVNGLTSLIASPPASCDELLFLVREKLASAPVQRKIQQFIYQQIQQENGSISLLPEIVQPLIIFTPKQIDAIIAEIVNHTDYDVKQLKDNNKLFTLTVNQIYREINKDLNDFSLPPTALEKLSTLLLFWFAPVTPLLPKGESKVLMQQIIQLLSGCLEQSVLDLHRQPFSNWSAIAAFISLGDKAFSWLYRATVQPELPAITTLPEIALPGFRPLPDNSPQPRPAQSILGPKSCALYISKEPEKLAFCPQTVSNSTVAPHQTEMMLALSADQKSAQLAIQTDDQPVVINLNPYQTPSLGFDLPVSASGQHRLISDGFATHLQQKTPKPHLSGVVERSPDQARLISSRLSLLRALLDFNTVYRTLPKMLCRISNFINAPLPGITFANAAPVNPAALNGAASAEKLWSELASSHPSPRRWVIYDPLAGGDRRSAFDQLLSQLPFELSTTQQDNLYSALSEKLVVFIKSAAQRVKRISEKESWQRCTINAAWELENAGPDESLGGKMIGWGEEMQRESLIFFRYGVKHRKAEAFLISGILTIVSKLADSAGKITSGEAFSQPACTDKSSWLLASVNEWTMLPENHAATAFRAGARPALRTVPKISPRLAPVLAKLPKVGQVKGARLTDTDTGFTLQAVLQAKINGKIWHLIPKDKNSGTAFLADKGSPVNRRVAIRTDGEKWSIVGLGEHRFTLDASGQKYLRIGEWHYKVLEETAEGTLKLSQSLQVYFDPVSKQWKEWFRGNSHLNAGSLAALPENLLNSAPGNQQVLSWNLSSKISRDSKLWRNPENNQLYLEVQYAKGNAVESKYIEGKLEGRFFTLRAAENQPVSQQVVLKWHSRKGKWQVASPFALLKQAEQLPLKSQLARPGRLDFTGIPGLYMYAPGKFLLRWQSRIAGNDVYLPLSPTHIDDLWLGELASAATPADTTKVFFRYDQLTQQWHLHRTTAAIFIDLPESVIIKTTNPFTEEYQLAGYRNVYRSSDRLFIKVGEEANGEANYIEVEQDQQHRDLFTLRIDNPQGADTLWKLKYQADEFQLVEKQICHRARRGNENLCQPGTSGEKRPAESEVAGSKKQKIEQPADNKLEEMLEEMLELDQRIIDARGKAVLNQEITAGITFQRMFDDTINILNDISTLSVEVKSNFIARHFGEINLKNKAAVFNDMISTSLENLKSYQAGGWRENQLVLLKKDPAIREYQPLSYEAKVFSLPDSDNALLVLNKDSFDTKYSMAEYSIIYMRYVRTVLHEASHIRKPLIKINQEGEYNIATKDYYYNPSDNFNDMSGWEYALRPYDNRIMYYSLDNDPEIFSEQFESRLQLKSFSDYWIEFTEDSPEYNLINDSETFLRFLSNEQKNNMQGLTEAVEQYNQQLHQVTELENTPEAAREDIEREKQELGYRRDIMQLKEKQILSLVSSYNDALKQLGLPEKNIDVKSLLQEPVVAGGEVNIDGQSSNRIDLYLRQIADDPQAISAVLLKNADHIAGKITLLAAEQGILDQRLPNPLIAKPNPNLPWEASSSEDSERK